MIAAAGFTGEAGRSTQASSARQERGQLEAVLLPVQPRPFQTKPHLELQGDGRSTYLTCHTCHVAGETAFCMGEQVSLTWKNCLLYLFTGP